MAAIPLVAGLAFTAFLAHSLHGSDKMAEAARVERNAMVACARDALKDTTYQSRDLIDFQTLGCSKTSDQWTLGAIRMYVMQPPQNSSAEVVFMVGIGITLSLLASLDRLRHRPRHRLGHWPQYNFVGAWVVGFHALMR